MAGPPLHSRVSSAQDGLELRLLTGARLNPLQPDHREGCDASLGLSVKGHSCTKKPLQLQDWTIMDTTLAPGWVQGR